MNKDLVRDVEKLKKDLSKFHDDIGATLSDVGSYSHEKVLHTCDKLKNTISEFEGIAADKCGRANEALHEKGEMLVHESRDAISKRPLTTVVAAFAAGLLTAYLLKRK